MDTMTPVYGSGTLLLIAAAAVAVLLALIIVLRMHAFVALVLVSMGTAVAAGVPLADVPSVAIAASGSTLGAVALNQSAEFVDAQLVADAKARGLQVNVYTVNDADEYLRLAALGVDGVFTDVPDRLRAVT